MGIRFIKISVIYFVIGVGLGYYMSIAHAYNLTPVHVHINLLGWTAMTLAGLIYHVFPQTASTKLATVHFWCHNIGLPLMMGGLTLMVLGYEQFFPVVPVGATLLVIGVVLFAINILVNLKSTHSVPKDQTLTQ
jgi:cbb3-type cytochrome oxidase subunit 1